MSLEQAKENTELAAFEDAAKKGPEAGDVYEDVYEYKQNYNKLAHIIDGTKQDGTTINDILTPKFQNGLLKSPNKIADISGLKKLLPDAIKKDPKNQQLKDLADFLNSIDPTSGTTTNKLDENNKDQDLGLAQETPKWKINNIINFVETNDALVSQYNLIGIADGNVFQDGGVTAAAIRNQCRTLITSLGDKMVIPVEYQNDYLNTLATKNPNEVLSLTRALVLLSQLPKATLDKISNKLSREVHTETVKSGDYRTGALNAYTKN